MGANTVNDAWNSYKKLKEIFKLAHMNLREFITNDESLNNWFPTEDRLENKKPKILGIPWDIVNDKIIIAFPETNHVVKTTRRTVLRQLASVFDPLGFVSPSMLSAKLFFQTLWEEKRNWDDKLNENEEKIWREIVESWSINPI